MCKVRGTEEGPDEKKMDVIKGEEAKRVASGGGHFRPTSDELGLRVCTK